MPYKLLTEKKLYMYIHNHSVYILHINDVMNIQPITVYIYNHIYNYNIQMIYNDFT